MSLPQHLEDHFQYIRNEVKKFNDDYKRHITESLPRYVSVPRYCDEMKLSMSYEEMSELAMLAESESRKLGKVVRIGQSPLGNLKCFYEQTLDSAYEIMTRPEN